MSPKKRGALALVLLSPSLLALSGCSSSNSNCDSNGSTLTTSDDCGTGRNRSGGYVGGVRSGSGVGSGSVRGGFGSSGHSFGSGGFGVGS